MRIYIVWRRALSRTSRLLGLPNADYLAEVADVAAKLHALARERQHWREQLVDAARNPKPSRVLVLTGSTSVPDRRSGWSGEGGVTWVGDPPPGATWPATDLIRHQPSMTMGTASHHTSTVILSSQFVGAQRRNDDPPGVLAYAR